MNNMFMQMDILYFYDYLTLKIKPKYSLNIQYYAEDNISLIYRLIFKDLSIKLLKHTSTNACTYYLKSAKFITGHLIFFEYITNKFKIIKNNGLLINPVYF
jgi:hypothetical protein